MFYVSMFLNEKDQTNLSEFVQNYVKILKVKERASVFHFQILHRYFFKLKRKFTNIYFIVLNFNSENNSKKIRHSDIVFYIVGTDTELDYFSSSFCLIGSNSYHEELYTILQHPRLVLIRLIGLEQTQLANLKIQCLKLPEKSKELIALLMRQESSLEGHNVSLLNESAHRTSVDLLRKPKKLVDHILEEINLNSFTCSLDKFYRCYTKSNKQLFAMQSQGFSFCTRKESAARNIQIS